MIADAIKQAKRMHRQAIEATYDGTCTIYEQQSYKDPETKVRDFKEAEVVSNKPCRLSFSSAPAITTTETASSVQQTIKLFLAPEIEVDPGSKIEVTQNGRTECFGRSGKPAVYDSHQEITLELWKGYA